MKKLLVSASVLALLFACSDDGPENTPDAGNGVDAYIPPPPPPPPPPPTEVTVSGSVIGLGSYLAGTPNYVGGVSVLGLGTSPPATAVSSPDGNVGSYSLVAPANGQILFFTNGGGYFPSYNSVTTQQANVADKNVYITELDWLNDIATTHGVDLAATFPCHGPPDGALDPNDQCVYSTVIGRIMDDGTAGNGTARPVGGVSALDFSVVGGPNSDSWYIRGPYFLNADGTPDAGNQTSIVENNGNEYLGGLYVAFVEVPQSVGPESNTIAISISYNDAGAGVTRQFGPQSVQAFRGSGVTWASVYETGIAPPPPPGPVDFDSQIYPLLLPVNQGGFGCQGCHTNQQDSVPAAGMNFYGGPEEAYASLNPANYPNRVNVANPGQSTLLTKPLYETVGPQNHPIFAFASEDDPAYRLIYTWIQEGGERVGDLPPVSFLNDIRPILYNAIADGGAGCYNCHVAGVDADTAPGGFYMGGTPEELFYELVQEQSTGDGGTGEIYRISRNGVIENSLVLTNPLLGHPEPHPTKIYPTNLDTRYQLIYRWIAEGYLDDSAP